MIWFFIGNIFSVMLPLKASPVKKIVTTKSLWPSYISVTTLSFIIWYGAVWLILQLVNLAKLGYTDTNRTITWILLIILPSLLLWLSSIYLVTRLFHQRPKVKTKLIRYLD